MSKKIVFATHNEYKLKEVAEMLSPAFDVLGLNDIGCTEDIEETEDTLEGNAFLKAAYVFEKYNLNCFSDDTGLEVTALDGAPGVYSARYAGQGRDSIDNMDKLLANLKVKSDRSAQFRTVIALIINGERYQFDGIVKGHIAKDKRGTNGFGYDPIFVPEGNDKAFAELGNEVKNQISHRARATQKLIDFLSTHEI